MSIRAIEIARECDILYAELYTTKLDTNVEKLSQVIGKRVIEIKEKIWKKNQRGYWKRLKQKKWVF